MTDDQKHTVLLLHAAVVGSWSLNVFGHRLEKQGFKIINHPYPNRRLTVCQAAEEMAAKWEKLAADSPGPVHVAGHSMGGLVARRLLYLHQPPNFGRMVTMGTPHQGSPLADKLHNWNFYQWLFGPAGHDLTTDHPVDWLAPWPPPYQIGLIAGGVPIGPGSFHLRGKSDGTVLAESSQPAGGHDYLTVKATHTMIPFLEITARLSTNFLKTGHFVLAARAPDAGASSPM